MPFILHMSDFHYSGESEELKEKLLSLARYLNDKKRKIEYLVCTGDFIDQKTAIDRFAEEFCKEHSSALGGYNYEQECKDRTYHISDKILTSSPKIIGEYNCRLLSEMTKLYEEFYECFYAFINELSLQHDQLIFCCGNHDKAWLVGSKAIPGSSGCASYSSEQHRIIPGTSDSKPQDDEHCYEAYDSFCKKFDLTYTHGMELYSKESDNDIEFLILNTNAGVVDTDKHCINCTCLNEKYKINEEKSKHSVVVMHAPYESLCEEVQRTYDAQRISENSIFRSAICSRATLGLCGDKHVCNTIVYDNTPFFMAGMFADKAWETSHWECRLIEYSSPKAEYMETPVKYCEEKSKWVDYLGLNEALNISREYANKSKIKERWESQDTTSASVRLNDLYSEDYFLHFSDSIKIVEKYRKDGNREDRIEIPDDKTIFRFIADRLDELENESFPIKIAGKAGSGKSSFAYSLWTRFLVDHYMEGTQSFMPAIFDYEAVKEVCGGKSDDIIKKWDGFIADCNSLLERTNTKKVLCIIDGLDDKMYFDSDPIIQFYEKIKTSAQNNSKFAFMLVVNLSSISCEPRKKLLQDVQSKDVMYLNSIDVFRLDAEESDSKLQLAVKKNLKLHNPTISEDKLETKKKLIVDFVKKIGYDEINLSILRMIIEDGIDAWNTKNTKQQAREKYYELLEKKWKQYLTTDDNDKLGYEIAFDDGIPDIIAQDSAASLIIANEDLRNLLSARYIVDHFICGGSSEILSQTVIPHSVALLVRSYLMKKVGREEIESTLTNYINKHYSCIRKEPVSPLIAYLFGSFLNENKRAGLLKRIAEDKPIVTAEEEYSDDTYKKVASAFFAEFLLLLRTGMTNENKRTRFYECLASMVFNCNLRKYYRVFLLDYYEDLSHNAVQRKDEFNDDYNKTGNDFKRCYYGLLSNLQNGTGEFPDEYLIFELADLVYSRLYQLNGYDPESEPNIQPYFAPKQTSKEEQCRAIQNVVTEVKKLLAHRKGSRGISEFAKNDPNCRSCYWYLKSLLLTFEECIKIYKNGTDDTKTLKELKKALHPSNAFNRVTKLKMQPRAGWFYTKTMNEMSEREKKHAENKFKSYYRNNIKSHMETISDHCIESMLIAELYLPETEAEAKKIDQNANGYSKDSVIRILLTHEIGKATIGDKPKFYMNDDEKIKYYEEVDGGMYAILFASILSGYKSGLTNLSMFQSETEQNAENPRLDYNQKVALDIGIIQREYTRKIMIQEHKFMPSNKRINSFEKSFSTATDLGKRIKNLLIDNNPYISG